MAVGPGEPPDRDLDRFRERAAALEAEFRSALSMVDNLQWRSQMTAGPPSQHVANEARGADLIVAALEPGERIFLPSPEIDVSDLLMRAGRPVLIAPPGATGLKLTRALVCWKDSREARRAVADALPILEGAAKGSMSSNSSRSTKWKRRERRRRRRRRLACPPRRRGELPRLAAERDGGRASRRDRQGPRGRSDCGGRVRPQPSARVGVRRSDAGPPPARPTAARWSRTRRRGSRREERIRRWTSASLKSPQPARAAGLAPSPIRRSRSSGRRARAR